MNTAKRIGGAATRSIGNAKRTRGAAATRSIDETRSEGKVAMATLEQNVQRLMDIQEIRDLKTQYALYCDDDYNPDGLAALFVENAVWDGGIFGRHEGRAAIREFFAGVSDTIDFALHLTVGDKIDIDPSGKTAKGSWYVIMPGTFKGPQAVWVAGTYADEYVKVDGKWYFQNVNAHLNFVSPYEKGWVKEQYISME